jgi:hypothetical protein
MKVFEEKGYYTKEDGKVSEASEFGKKKKAPKE